jgi:hypothetical protein
VARGSPATEVFAPAALVETLLGRGSDSDVQEAADAIERLTAVPTDPGFVLNEIELLRMRALLACARGDETGYRDYRDRYRDMARTRGFEGHIAWAEAMTGGRSVPNDRLPKARQSQNSKDSGPPFAGSQASEAARSRSPVSWCHRRVRVFPRSDTG